MPIEFILNIFLLKELNHFLDLSGKFAFEDEILCELDY